MLPPPPFQFGQERFTWEQHLFLTIMTATLLRFRHVAEGADPRDIQIMLDRPLNDEDLFADMQVQVQGALPYLVEVLGGLSKDEVTAEVARRYGPDGPPIEPVDKVLLLVEDAPPPFRRRLEEIARPGLQLEIWDRVRLLGIAGPLIGFAPPALDEEHILEFMEQIERAKGRFAFGKQWENSYAQRTVLWHVGEGSLRYLIETLGADTRAAFQPGEYPDVVVLMADLSSYSSFVKDTEDPNISHRGLTTFCTKARFTIHETGGVMYRFSGDEVVGVYGLPMRDPGYIERALEAARRINDIGNAVSYQWQQSISGGPKSRGVHTGMALGSLQLISLSPFDRVQMDVVGTVINTAARLQKFAGPGEVVASDACYQRLGPQAQAGFEQMEDVEAKNIGTVQAWKLRV